MCDGYIYFMPMCSCVIHAHCVLGCTYTRCIDEFGLVVSQATVSSDHHDTWLVDNTGPCAETVEYNVIDIKSEL